MTIADDARGVAMGQRVRRTAEHAGVDEVGLALVQGCHDVARQRREVRLDDDHDPHYLHPGRTALILLLDTGETSATTLAAAILTETHRPDLHLADRAVLEATPESLHTDLETVLALRSEIPGPDDPGRVERLVTAPAEALRVAVAERLDHARHAHMWHEGPADPAFLEEADEVWIALAERAHPRLGQRYRRWARGTRARLSRRRRPDA